MPTIKIVNVETGEEIEREMNAEELAQFEADQELKIMRKETEEARATQKAALLNRLGITEDEAKLLLA
jgi:hypothetical protein